jgi:hypothetical protein
LSRSEVAVEHIHTYLVHPSKGSDDTLRVGGTAVPLNGTLFKLLDDIYRRSETDCDIDISFNQGVGGRRSSSSPFHHSSNTDTCYAGKTTPGWSPSNKSSRRFDKARTRWSLQSRDIFRADRSCNRHSRCREFPTLCSPLATYRWAAFAPPSQSVYV